MKDAQVGGSYRPSWTKITAREPLRRFWQFEARPYTRGARNSEILKIEPTSQPNLVDQPAAPSDPIQPFPSQALGHGLASIMRHQSS